MATIGNHSQTPATKEEHLKRPVDRCYWTPQELAANQTGSTHAHAVVEVPGGEHALVGDMDFILEYERYAVGIIELKCFWNVTARAIDEVLNGLFLRLKAIDNRDRPSKRHRRPSRPSCGETAIRIHDSKRKTVRNFDHGQRLGFHVPPKQREIDHVTPDSLRCCATATPHDSPSHLLHVSSGCA